MAQRKLDQTIETAVNSRSAAALEVLSWSALIAGFVVCSLLSLLGDMTPWPFDGTIFGELGGAFLLAMFLKGYRRLTGGSQ